MGILARRQKRMAQALKVVAAGACLWGVLLSPTFAGAVKVEVEKDTFLDFHLLLQPWAQFRYEDLSAEAEKQHGFGDFYLRRTRIIVAGQITKWVNFFVETDQPNWGKGGDWTSSPMIIQDAYVSFDLHEKFRLVAGMLLTPFVHNLSQGAVNLHTLDYHVDLAKYPQGSNKGWRDMGVMARGFLLHRKIDYRLAITNGVQDGAEVIKATETTPAVVARTGECPRFSGRIAYNFFDAEEGFFLGGTYLGKKKVLSVGLAYDAQPGVYGDGGHYWGLGGDIFVDIPLGYRRLSGQLDVVAYGGNKNPNRGVGAAFDLGYAIGRFEPLVSVDWFRPEGGAKSPSSSWASMRA